MDPAYSVILFTSASGAGYGLLVWLALARLTGLWELDPVAAVVSCGIALVLITAGLLSSTFHLGHPERAWRAMSQWQSSWLSREGVFAILTYPPALVFSAGLIWPVISPLQMQIAAAATAVLSLVTVISTGMIYASLKTIPRWHNGWTLAVYVVMALASGGLLFALTLAFSGAVDQVVLIGLLGVLLACWLIKWIYWRKTDGRESGSTTGTATGLGQFGKVTQLEAPHTSENYLLKEMGYQIGRKHATRLRRIALNLGLMIPGLALIFAGLSGDIVQLGLLIVALLSGLTGVVIERWLFFAEARHVVTLFYGRSL